MFAFQFCSFFFLLGFSSQWGEAKGKISAGVAEAEGGKGCDGAAEEALRLTNQYRAKHGVGPLELDPKISAKSQSWADDLHRRGVSLFDGPDAHSDLSRGAGLYNSENLGETPTVASSVEMFYNEIKDYDFNNPPEGSTGRNGKPIGHFVNMIWKDQRKMGVGCAPVKSEKSPGNYIYVINYLKENGGRGSKRENVLPPKMTPAPPSSAGPTTGLMDQVEGEYVQTQPPASNDWHYVNITKKEVDNFTWKNKAGVEWDLIQPKESSGVVIFQVGDNCLYKKDGYTEAKLSFKEDTIEIDGPHGVFTKEKK